MKTYYAELKDGERIGGFSSVEELHNYCINPPDHIFEKYAFEPYNIITVEDEVKSNYTD